MTQDEIDTFNRQQELARKLRCAVEGCQARADVMTKDRRALCTPCRAAELSKKWAEQERTRNRVARVRERENPTTPVLSDALKEAIERLRKVR